ncbi:MAG TPA: CRTAC1 family protein [Acidobacteriota bacterium]|nr:CRTAC1 family protein [Acidobacteriota bacterium]
MRTAIVVLGLSLPTLAPAQDQSAIRFDEVTTAIGLDFVHARGARGAKHLPETMGAGVAWVDYDGDGDYDLYFVQSGPLPGADEPTVGNAMFRNDEGLLVRVLTGAEHTGYGMGVAAADWDGDGFTDLFVSNLGPDVLLRNNGDGTYSEQLSTGLEDPRWSTSAAWSDLDRDGLVDLYVLKYVVYDFASALGCGEQQRQQRSYCHIDLFVADADTVYRNSGDGAFEDRSESAGVANATEGKGLGVAIGDLTDDGYPDIYVANDTQQNFLYVNLGDWSFEERGLFSGTGYSESGTGLAGMGTDMVDLDGDGRGEILVTNFAFENNHLYREVAPGAYLDDSSSLGLGAPGFAALAFGITTLDADADGDIEIAVANGHILDNVTAVQDNTTYPQRNHLFENHLTSIRGARLASGGAATTAAGWRPETNLFTEVSATAGPGFAAIDVSRGLATGDLDGDGLADLVVTNSGGPARLLANRATAPGQRLVVRLRGRNANRDALDARVTVTPLGGDANEDGAAGFGQVRIVRSGSSYLSQGATDLYFGLATSSTARIEILWPDGESQTIEAAAGQLVLVVQGHTPKTQPLAAPDGSDPLRHAPCGVGSAATEFRNRA